MADSPSNFAALPLRQKVTVIVFLMIAVFIVWEVIGMFRGSGGSSSANITPAQPTAATTSASTPKPALTQTPPATPHPAAAIASPPPHVGDAAHLTPQRSHPQIETMPPASPALLQQEQVQTKYVSALNELQMLKIQKEIAETSQAIVAAKLATATAEKSISDLLSEAEAVSNPASTGKNISAATSTTVTPSPPPLPEVNNGTYSVQSVSMEQDQWHAVVKFKDKLYDVSVGDMLPPDNSTVKAIDQRGVTLENGGFERKIPLTVTDNVGPLSGPGSSHGNSEAGPGAGPGS